VNKTSGSRADKSWSVGAGSATAAAGQGVGVGAAVAAAAARSIKLDDSAARHDGMNRRRGAMQCGVAVADSSRVERMCLRQCQYTCLPAHLTGSDARFADYENDSVRSAAAVQATKLRTTPETRK